MLKTALLLIPFVFASALGPDQIDTYKHPSVTLTALTLSGKATPEALTYEGPKGFFFIRYKDLRCINEEEEFTGTPISVYEMTEKGFLYKTSWTQSFLTSYNDAGSVRIVESILAAAFASYGLPKQNVPLEAAGDINLLRRWLDRQERKGNLIHQANQRARGSLVTSPRLFKAGRDAIPGVRTEINQVEKEMNKGPKLAENRAAFYLNLVARMERITERLHKISDNLRDCAPGNIGEDD